MGRFPRGRSEVPDSAVEYGSQRATVPLQFVAHLRLYVGGEVGDHQLMERIPVWAKFAPQRRELPASVRLITSTRGADRFNHTGHEWIGHRLLTRSGPRSRNRS
jgi:hypothetical protein